jgi:hypothetical protein
MALRDGAPKTHGSYEPLLDPLLELIDDGTIKGPSIPASNFDHAPAAHRRLAERNNIGKVILVPTKLYTAFMAVCPYPQVTPKTFSRVPPR